ncbi:histone H2B.1, embryonic-like isoform X2 [Fopius arisanus]|uniref:Histone H2B.1, embryonic-like isoform X2 n=1 Tax=Fopius arisanus TaxID=64838 RepID=A0A9R1T3K7_9HYME|nr:PREDICTED: histone H2B.1, embryonic-like isoform X2 [Fopius arisanus]
MQQRKSHKRKRWSNAVYIYRVLMQMYPDTGLATRILRIITLFGNSILEGLLQRLRVGLR